MKNHRYPEEVKTDAINRTLRQQADVSTQLFHETARLYPGMGIQIPWKSGMVRFRIENTNQRGTKGRIKIESVIEYEVKGEQTPAADKPAT